MAKKKIGKSGWILIAAVIIFLVIAFAGGVHPANCDQLWC